MPESKNRKRRGSQRAAGVRSGEDGQRISKKSPLNDADVTSFDDFEDETLPLWYRSTMIGLMILGLLWLITWYITQGAMPVQAAGGWNVMIGFGIAMVGFFMTMRWK